MALQNALTLIFQLRQEKASPENLEEMSRLGKERGLECTVEEVEAAFLLDYDMRWARYRSILSEEHTVR